MLKSMCIVAISHAQAQQTRVDNRVHCERKLQINTSPNSTMKSLFLGTTINGGTFNISVNLARANTTLMCSVCDPMGAKTVSLFEVSS